MKALVAELKDHIPFTALASSLALIIMLSLHFSNPDFLVIYSESLFHIFHPVHILLSATTTTTMFYKYKKKILKAIIVGLTGSLAICAISDVIIPYVGGITLGADMRFHLDLIEKPWLIIPSAFFGVFIGLKIKRTIFPHSSHVLISTLATLFYLITYGFVWYRALFQTFIIVFIAVTVPCCTSDIIFPVLASKKKI